VHRRKKLCRGKKLTRYFKKIRGLCQRRRRGSSYDISPLKKEGTFRQPRYKRGAEAATPDGTPNRRRLKSSTKKKKSETAKVQITGRHARGQGGGRNLATGDKTLAPETRNDVYTVKAKARSPRSTRRGETA